MSDELRRVAMNEALYRSINERIEDINRSFGIAGETITVICECGDLHCTERIELDLETYEQIRADRTHFVVLAGHELPELEQTVERRTRFSIVAKDPELLGRFTEGRE